MHTKCYQVHHVTSLVDLVDMMRYDGMRFDSSSQSQAIRWLSKRDLGIIEVTGEDTREVSVKLIKDTDHKRWIPTFERWQSFGMLIELEE